LIGAARVVACAICASRARVKAYDGQGRRATTQVAHLTERFLEHFACLPRCHHRSGAGRWLLQARSTAGRTRRGFRAGFREAEQQAVEALEREAWRRGVKGTPHRRTSYWHGEPVGTDDKVVYSDQLLMLLLRARKPDTYREKVDVAVSQVIETVAGIDPESVL
jgi:hypothetical protein